uniref:Uncharacterized protein n=1 Tax=Gorilla gorilla gorilla TaxID=9595 RepID=A0A2I2YXR2_GORGO
MSSTTQTPTAFTQPVHSCLFTHTAPDRFLQRCNKPSSLCLSIVCISLYFIHVLLMYRHSLKLVSLW